jgi:hypothetical protein
VRQRLVHSCAGGVLHAIGRVGCLDLAYKGMGKAAIRRSSRAVCCCRLKGLIKDPWHNVCLDVYQTHAVDELAMISWYKLQ